MSGDGDGDGDGMRKCGMDAMNADHIDAPIESACRWHHHITSHHIS